MQRLSIILLALLASLLVGCAGLGESPEQVARGMAGPPDQVVDYRLLGKRQIAEGTVLFSTYQLLPKDNDPGGRVLGYVFVGSRPLANPHGGGILLDVSNTSGIFFNGVRGQASEQTSFTFGQPLSPDVATVELRFADGATKQEVPANGLFVFMHPTKAIPCTLTALDAGGETLETLFVGEGEDACNPAP